MFLRFVTSVFPIEVSNEVRESGPTCIVTSADNLTVSRTILKLLSSICFYNSFLLNGLYLEVLETGCALKIMRLSVCSES